MAEKKTPGRQKIPLAKIEDANDRYVTFTKRRSSLYRKASDLIEKYDVDMGIIISSPTGKPYSFFHPTMDAVVDRFLGPNLQPSESSCLVVANSRMKVKELKAELDELNIVEKALSDQKPDETDVKELWESIKELNEEDVKKHEDWLDSVDLKLYHRWMMLENGASSSAQAPPENAN